MSRGDGHAPATPFGESGMPGRRPALRFMGSVPRKLYQPLEVNERLDFSCAVCGAAILVAAAGGAEFLDRLFDRFTGFAGALLNPANQFFLLAFDEL